MKKIWKALFYSFWMSDKVPVQQALADLLARLIHCFADPAKAMLWWKCFVVTMDTPV